MLRNTLHYVFTYWLYSYIEKTCSGNHSVEGKNMFRQYVSNDSITHSLIANNTIIHAGSLYSGKINQLNDSIISTWSFNHADMIHSDSLNHYSINHSISFWFYPSVIYRKLSSHKQQRCLYNIPIPCLSYHKFSYSIHGNLLHEIVLALPYFWRHQLSLESLIPNFFCFGLSAKSFSSIPL
jgi:hypothetical protein